MEKHTNLTPRLQLLADWVAPGANLADIGTDHAYLPAWLIRSGRVHHAIACDLRSGPLSHARETAAEYGISDKLELRLGDGLHAISPEEADTIVIAGMGGENIAAILQAAPWAADGRHTLLLQSMTRTEVLREFLAHSGYAIQREQLVEDRGILYSAIMASGGKMVLNVGQIYGGAKLVQDPLENRYLIELILRFQNMIAGLNHSSILQDREKADQYRAIVGELLNMREEWRHAHCSDN